MSLLRQFALTAPLIHTRNLFDTVLADDFELGDAESFESLCEFAFWLYVDGSEADALQVCDCVVDREFDHNFDTWTWIEFMLALRARLSATSGDRSACDLFRTQITAAVESGDDAKVKLKRKVHGRLLAGSQLRFDKVQDAIDAEDRHSELDWRMVLLKHQIKLEQLGGSEAVAVSDITTAIDSNIRSIQALVAQWAITASWAHVIGKHRACWQSCSDNDSADSRPAECEVKQNVMAAHAATMAEQEAKRQL
jgi:hypothetical protein